MSEKLLEFDLDGKGNPDAPGAEEDAFAESEEEPMVEILKPPDYYAHRFIPAHPSNYTAGREGNRVRYLVVHITQGSYEGSIEWGRNPASNVSWTYIVSLAGHTTQMVSEKHTIWTNSNWYVNQRAVSIEHEGYHPRRPEEVPEAQLHASAKLAAGACLRHGIPIDRDHIFGHNEISGVTKPCPSGWPWEKYIALIKQYAGESPTPPRPSPAPSIQWINVAHHPDDGWARKVATAMAEALSVVGVRGGVTPRYEKAARDAREQEGVYSFIVGEKAIRGAKATGITGPVRAVGSMIRQTARWRIAAFCDEHKLDKGKALAAFSEAMGESPKEGESEVERAIALGMALRGAPYGNGWREGTWPDGPSLYARCNPRVHTVEYIRNHELICSALLNVLRAHIAGLPAIGRAQGDGWPGGTAAVGRTWARMRGVRPYNPRETPPRGWVVYSPYLGAPLALQGHAGISLGNGYLLEAQVPRASSDRRIVDVHNLLIRTAGVGFTHQIPPDIWLKV
jgi:N-acetylmuramoyl-L-alanine amidase